MIYREDKHGNKLSALGLGCMRFSMSKAETERMISRAIEGGVNFFDTAYLYPGSEATLGEILEKLDRRKDIYIATKLPIMLCKAPDDFDKFFNEQLKRLKTDYIDYYFLHNITDFNQFDALRQIGIIQWIEEKKAKGEIKQIGFSFHGVYSEFEKILDAYQWEFTMIQYNYYAPNYQAGVKGLKLAAEKNIAVMIMEPLLGGQLATGLPKQASQIFSNANQNRTPAEWAFSWLWNQPEVTVAVSGMGSEKIMDSNIKSIANFKPLADSELSVYGEVSNIFRKLYKINCTNCNYCLPCPLGINIPACLSAYNASYIQGFKTGITMYLTTTGVTRKKPLSPNICNGCGKCEKACPQGIKIRDELKKVYRRLEPLPLRLILRGVRRILR